MTSLLDQRSPMHTFIPPRQLSNSEQSSSEQLDTLTTRRLGAHSQRIINAQLSVSRSDDVWLQLALFGNVGQFGMWHHDPLIEWVMFYLYKLFMGTTFQIKFPALDESKEIKNNKFAVNIHCDTGKCCNYDRKIRSDDGI